MSGAPFVEMSSSLFANVLQQNKPPPKSRKYEAGGAGVPGAVGDPLAVRPPNKGAPIPS